MKSWLLFAVCMIGVWQIAAFALGNPILLPSPWTVAETMAAQAGQPKLYEALAATCIRALTGAVLAFGVGFACAVLSWFFKTAAWFFKNLCVVMQSVPNVAYIILMLFWMSRDQAVVMVCFLLLFGVVYQSFFRAIEAIASRAKDIIFLYPQPKIRIVRQVFLPELRPVFLSCASNCISMSFKAAVMAEILASAALGIGRNMQQARQNLDAASLIGWVIWLVLTVFLFDWLAGRILKWLFDH